MTPRVKRSLKTVIEWLAKYDVEAEPEWLDPASGKQKEKVMLRHFTWRHLAANNPQMSYPQIAMECKVADHSSIIYGINRCPYHLKVLSGEIVPYDWRKTKGLTPGPLPVT